MALGSASTIGGIKVEIGADASKLDKELSRSQKSIAAWGKQAKVAAAVGAGAFVAAATMVIRATVEQEKAVSQLEAAMKSTGNAAGFTSKQYQEMASSLQGMTTYGDEAIIQAQALLQTFRLSGPVFQRAQTAILDMSAALGKSLPDAAKTVGMALADPVRGIKKLREANISLTKSQEEMIKSMAASGDQAGAQRAILDALEGTYKGAAAAARNTLGGAIESLKNAFGDLLESNNIGGLTASLNELTKTMSSSETKEGFAAVTGGIIDISNAAVRGISYLGKLGVAIGEATASAAGGESLESRGAVMRETAKVNKELESLYLERHGMIERVQRRARAGVPGATVDSSLTEGIDAQIAALEDRRKLLENSFKNMTSDLISGRGPEETKATEEAKTKVIVDEYARRMEILAKLQQESPINPPEGATTESGMLEQLDEVYALKFEKEMEHLEAIKALRAGYQTDFVDTELALVEQIADEKARLRDLALTGEQNFWSDVNSAAQSGSEKQKKIFQKIAIAQAVVKGYEAATSAWAAGMATGGPWAPLIAASYTAASLAKTAGLISSIKSSGQSQSASVGGGVTGMGAADAAQRQPTQTMSVNFSGGDYEKNIAAGIIGIINTELERGAVLSGVALA